MSSHNIYKVREWMYSRLDDETRAMRLEFKEGLMEFMQFASNQETTRIEGIMACPCVKCCTDHFLAKDIVWSHFIVGRFYTRVLYMVFSWGRFRSGPSNSRERRDENIIIRDDHVYQEEDNITRIGSGEFHDNVENTNVVEEPYLETQGFFDMLDAANHPIYAGCREGHTPLSAVKRMMNIKTD